jgi:hypothetical protein
MKKTKQTFVFCILLGVIGLLTYAGAVEAGLRAEDITGAVEYALTDALQWQPLTREVVLVAGNHIRTGKNGAVGLKGDDGSVLYLEKDAQLAIAALEFSKADQKRVSHFNLSQGKLTVKAAAVNFAQAAFKIETNTVVTQFQDTGSEAVATIVAPKIATSSSISQVFPLEGEFDLYQKHTGETQVLLNMGSEAGVKFSMLNQESLTTVGIQNEQYKEQHKVWVKTDYPLSKMSFLTDHEHNTVRVTNRENGDPCEVTIVKDKVFLVEPDSSLSVGGGSIHEYFAKILGTKTNLEFVWTKDPTLPPNTIVVKAEDGKILFLVQLPGEEKPVIPPPPVEEIIPKYVGSPIKP